MNANILKILTWNVRGPGHPLYHNQIMEIINKHHLGILILVEMKIVRSRATKICSRLPFTNFEYADPKDYKGVWML